MKKERERKAINFPCLVVYRNTFLKVYFLHDRYFCGVAKIRSKIVKKNLLTEIIS